MLKLIIEKELREIISSNKFTVTFGVSAVLILLAFYVGARNHQLNVSRYHAAKTENLRQMEGLTDWLSVDSHRIFLPPQPLAALVTGISNDIGRNITMAGRGELTAEDGRFNADPIFAVFRFLDLEFVMQIVLSLFAILFAYDAVNGEKERGTLRLCFANPVSRHTYMLGKLIGMFGALSLPLIVVILIGCLMLSVTGIQLTDGEWLRLMLVFVAGLLYFSVFLILSVFISSRTQRSAHSFLWLLVIWIFSVLILPRASILLAGRAVDVPSVDEIASEKSRLRMQLWNEDRKKMASFKPAAETEPDKMVEDLNKFMQDLADARDEKMQALSSRLNEQRRNAQLRQQRWAFGLARISPSATFSLAATNLVGTSVHLQEHFLQEAHGYQKTYAEFMQDKTGMRRGRGVMMFRQIGDSREEEKPIDPHELPTFNYTPIPVKEAMTRALPDFGVLALFNLIFFAGAFVFFLRYDVR